MIGRGRGRGRGRGNRDGGQIPSGQPSARPSSTEGTQAGPSQGPGGSGSDRQNMGRGKGRGKRGGVGSTTGKKYGKALAKPKVTEISKELDGVNLLTVADLEVNEMEEDMTAEEELLLKVFQNDLIFSKIGSMLNYGDIRALSEVSKRFHQITRLFRPFTDRTKFTLSYEGHRKHVYQPSIFPWTSIVCQMKDLVKPIGFGMTAPILAAAEHLVLHDHGLGPKAKAYKFLNQFFTSSPNLKSLALDYTILTRNLKTVLEDPEVIERLTNLESFSIIKVNQDEDYLVDDIPAANIQALLKIPFELKTLVYQRIKSTEFGETIPNFLPMVENCKTSLRELVLHCHPFTQPKMGKIVCPHLTKLDVNLDSHTEADFMAFLRSQPLLHSLGIRHKDGIHYNLLSLLRERCARLTKLDLRGQFFILQPPPLPPQAVPAPPPQDDEEEDWNNPPPALVQEPLPLDLSFLGGISGLTEVILAQSRSHGYGFAHNGRIHEFRATVAMALSALPSKVRAITFSRMPNGWIGEETLAGVTALSRFTHLVKLNLLDCDDAINDDILQFIISTFRLLRVFRMSRCHEVTGVGLTGGTLAIGDPAGVSLKNLKGLRELSITNCERLRAHDFVESVEFLELVALDIRIDGGFTCAVMTKIINQNPSLESFTTNSDLSVLDAVKLRLGEMKTRIKPDNVVFKLFDKAISSPIASVTDSDSDDEFWSDDYSSVSGVGNAWELDPFDLDDEYHGQGHFGDYDFDDGPGDDEEDDYDMWMN